MISKTTTIFGRACGLSLFVFALSACANVATSSAQLTPEQAIFRAADAAPAPVPGTFVLTVKAVGSQGGIAYLNSELDYRDQRNLSVAICPDAIAPLAAKFGGDLDKALIGKTIAVSGAAMRFKIVFTINGAPTEKYYYQTHVDVCSANQISLQR